ncbi:MAG: hypothetical protein AVDCRST_MAG65-610 [uncultured Solirubrobacteraceae bacterium]|uniref:Probable membrane transporter protein n=1 Tax=uncultured Solirubrobacteraceae bacterium TaxID=1162706 RepID=A0A6J4RBB0_9ACTN|nr:MAG: hypothetical protein AVDCRST_MAG65-610 [uncultured Solirubrobacteraceae bacterium]
MTALDFLILTATGLAAGMASSMVGGASLISFPVLLGLGIPPLIANVTNTSGLVPTAIGAALASQPELRGQRSQLTFLAIPAVLGSLGGVALLLAFPAATFERLVPFLIGGSSLLVGAQPWVMARVGSRLMSRNRGGLWCSTLVACCYGGYFGAAAAVLFLGLAGLFSSDTMHQLNALKNVLMGIANAVAMVAFAFLADPLWSVAAALAIGSLTGGAIGMKLVRFVPARVLRAVIAVLGVGVALWIGLT